jgi:hypothetical protein
MDCDNVAIEDFNSYKDAFEYKLFHICVFIKDLFQTEEFMIATSYQHIPFIILHDHMELDKSFLKKYKYLRSNEMGINSILASNADKALKEVLNVLDPSYHNIFVSRNYIESAAITSVIGPFDNVSSLSLEFHGITKFIPIKISGAIQKKNKTAMPVNITNCPIQDLEMKNNINHIIIMIGMTDVLHILEDINESIKPGSDTYSKLISMSVMIPVQKK